MSFLKALGGGIKSAFTNSGIEMPEYTVIANHGDYEEREYPRTKWVSVAAKKMVHDDAVRESFWNLFKYIQGENEKGTQIDMTAPVSIKVEPGAGPNCESTFTTSFYIGKEHAENPPLPNHEKLFLDSWQPFTVYVRTFGGFAKSDKWIEEAAALAASLKEEHKVVQDFYYTCGYNSPFKLFNRRNEVWLIKEGSISGNTLSELEAENKE